MWPWSCSPGHAQPLINKPMQGRPSWPERSSANRWRSRSPCDLAPGETHRGTKNVFWTCSTTKLLSEAKTKWESFSIEFRNFTLWYAALHLIILNSNFILPYCPFVQIRLIRGYRTMVHFLSNAVATSAKTSFTYVTTQCTKIQLTYVFINCHACDLALNCQTSVFFC